MSKVPVDALSQRPWDSIVCIISTFPDGFVGSGSGVMVGPNDVLTAAYIIYEADHGGTAVNVTVVPAFEPIPLNAPFGAANAVTYLIPQAYFLHPLSSTAATIAGAEHDVALLGLSVSLGNLTGWMGLDPNFQSGIVHETGYPDRYGNRMMDDVGYVQRDAAYDVLNATSLEAWPGDSGGPLWYSGPDGAAEVAGLTSTVFFDANRNPTGHAVAAFDISADYNFLTTAIASNDALIV